MYQLYYSPGACSMAVHVLLLELGQKFEGHKIVISKGENKTPEFLKINPRGSVPVLVDGDRVIREGAAMMLYLMHKHQSSLLPPEGQELAQALEWLMFANATLHPAYSRGFGLLKNEKLDNTAKDQLMAATVQQINTYWSEVDEKLAKTKYIAGEGLTAADILLTVIANWSHNFPGITLGSNVKRLLKEVSARPAYQQALKEEQVEYKAAA